MRVVEMIRNQPTTRRIVATITGDRRPPRSRNEESGAKVPKEASICEPYLASMSPTVRTVGSSRNTSCTQHRLHRGKALAIELEVHRRRRQRSDRHEDPLGDVADDQLGEGRAPSRQVGDPGERGVEPEQRSIRGRQVLVELRRLVDRHAEPDDGDHDGADHHGDLERLARQAVDERAKAAAPSDALERSRLVAARLLAELRS